MNKAQHYYHIYDLTLRASRKRSELKFYPYCDQVQSELNEGKLAMIERHLTKYKADHLEAYQDAIESQAGDI